MIHTQFLLLASIALSLAACASGSSGNDFSPFNPFVVATDAASAPSALDVAAPDAPDDASSTGTIHLSVDDDSDQEDTGQDSAQDDAGDARVTPVASSPSPGDLVISEVMYAPSGPIPAFQWFEVCNLTNAPLLLSGLTIDNGQGDLTAIPADPPVVVDPYAFALVVRSRAGAAAAQLPSGAIVYEYGAGVPAGQGIQLATDPTGDLALWNGGTLLADVPYGTWSLAATGQSIELAYLRYAGADQPGSWCAALFPWGTETDEGTPGHPSDCF
jgi:hypothetical protein